MFVYTLGDIIDCVLLVALVVLAVIRSISE